MGPRPPTAFVLAILVFGVLVVALGHGVSVQGASGYPTSTYTISGHPQGIALAHDNHDLYIANQNGYVLVFDPSSGSVVKNITSPGYLTWATYDNATGDVYVSDLTGSKLVVINTTTNTLGAAVHMPNFVSLGVTYGDGEIFVMGSNFSQAGFVKVYSPQTGKFVANITVGNSPALGAYDGKDNRLYVTNYYGNTTSVIDLLTNKVIATIPVPNFPYGVGYGNGKVYVTEYGSNVTAVIDTSTNTIVANVKVGNQPNGVAYAEDPLIGVSAYDASGLGLGTTSFIDPLTDEVVGSVSTPNGPQTIIYDHYLGEFFVVQYDGLLTSYTVPLVSPPTTSTTSSSTSTTTSTSMTTTTSSETTSSTSASSTSTSSSSSSTSSTSTSTSASSSTTATPASVPWLPILLGLGLLALVAGVGGYLLLKPKPPCAKEKAEVERCRERLQQALAQLAANPGADEAAALTRIIETDRSLLDTAERNLARCEGTAASGAPSSGGAGAPSPKPLEPSKPPTLPQGSPPTPMAPVPPPTPPVAPPPPVSVSPPVVIPPSTREKPKPPHRDPCPDGSGPTKNVACSCDVELWVLSKAKIEIEGAYLSGEEDIDKAIQGLENALSVAGIGAGLIGAVSDPVGSILGTLGVPSVDDATGKATDAAVDALKGLGEKLKKLGKIGWMKVTCPRARFRLSCVITSECQDGYWVVTDRSLKMEKLGPLTPVTMSNAPHVAGPADLTGAVQRIVNWAAGHNQDAERQMKKCEDACQ